MPFEIRTDLKKNRLYVTLSGLMEDAEVTLAADATIEAVKKMMPGFAVVNDISKFRPLSQGGVQEAKRAGEFAHKMGMVATVRVVGASATVHNQFERASREGGYTAHTYTAQSLAQAEELLDKHR
jgi:hypothetical protein